MRKFFPVDDLARDERFNKITMRDRMKDARTDYAPRTRSQRKQGQSFD